MDIGIDIGGTHVKGVLIREDRVEHQLSRATLDGEANWQKIVAEVYRELKHLAGDQLSGIGLSAPGIVDPDNRAIAYMPVRLQGLERFIWSDFLDWDVHVLNDAHAALWAESRWGVGKGIDNQIMLTLGTGVGGGILIEGRLLQGFLQRAGHLGHISIDAASEIPSITGITGSLEDAIGEASLSRRSLGRFQSTYDLVQAHLAGDTWATYLWLDSVRKLSLAIVSLCNALSPELIVLAGGITKAGPILTDTLRAFMDLYEWRPAGRVTPIVIAQFEDYAGAIGAALFARSRNKH